jgi:protein TonB
MTRERAFGWFGSVAMQLFALGALGVSPYMRYDDLPEPANAVPLHQYVPVIETIRAPTPKQRTLAATRAIPKAARIFSDFAPVEIPDGIPAEEAVIFDEGVEGVPIGFDSGFPHSDGPAETVEKTEQPPPEGPVRVGGSITAPRKIRHENPIYPPIAVAARIEGTVILEATIDETGTVVNVRVLRSIPLLDEAAIEAVLDWSYEPTLLNGSPVPILMSVSVTFELGR